MALVVVLDRHRHGCRSCLGLRALAPPGRGRRLLELTQREHDRGRDLGRARAARELTGTAQAVDDAVGELDLLAPIDVHHRLVLLQRLVGSEVVATAVLALVHLDDVDTRELRELRRPRAVPAAALADVPSVRLADVRQVLLICPDVLTAGGHQWRPQVVALVITCSTDSSWAPPGWNRGSYGWSM